MSSFFGAKGGGGSFKQRPDTLRSNDTFEAILGLCSGPIKGLKNGLRSLKIDGTPLENVDGTRNFGDFFVEFADGDPLKHPQTPVLRLGGGVVPVQIGVDITNPGTGSSPGPWVTRTVNNPNADFIDLRFIVQQLYRQDKKGIFSTTANLEIQMKPTASTTWINPVLSDPTIGWAQNGFIDDRGIIVLVMRSLFDGNGNWIPEANNGYFKIDGKTTSPSVHELRVTVPNEGAYANTGWDVRVRLIERDTLDADPNFEKRTINWESAAAGFKDGIGGNEDWRGLAWMQVSGKASDQLSGIPEIEGEYDTAIVQVPPSTVYNPTTRQYTGAIWDGTWEKAFTTDPAWIINWVISDPLSGISSVAAGSYLNKWDALELSKWCSQLVPDGGGNFEPRFSLNFRSEQPQKADEFIRYLAGAVGAVAWDTGNGEWRLKVEKPETPVDIFTTESIEGEFIYTHTEIDSRYNDITMAFLNKEQGYREDRVRVVDNAHIATYGRRPTTLVAVGCTGRQEALRRAMLRLRTSTREFRSVTFTTNRRGRLLSRLDTILIADGDLNASLDVASTGRIIAMNPAKTEIELRDPVRLELGASYTLHVTIPNPAYTPSPTTQPPSLYNKPTITITRTITNTNAERGDVTVLKLDSALPGDIALNANVALDTPGLPSLPRAYRIVDLTFGDDGERVTVSAIEIDTGKFNAADNVSPADSVLQAPSDIVPVPLAPSSGPILLDTLMAGELGFRRQVTVNWRRPANRFITGFRVSYSLNNGPLQVLADRTPDTTVELIDPAPGTYKFLIQTIDRRGRLSLPLEDEIEIGEINANSLVAYLTNEAHVVPANNSGGVTSYAGATGDFKVFSGTLDVSSAFTLSTQANPQNLTVVYSDRTFTVSGGLDAGEPNATLTIRATGSGPLAGITLDKVFTLTKSLAGIDGSSPPLITLTGSHFNFRFDGTGTPFPQTTTLTATRQNTSDITLWRLLRGDTRAPVTGYLTAAAFAAGGYCSGSSNADSVFLTELGFDNLNQAYGGRGLIYEAWINGTSVYDSWSLVRTSDGANGAPGADGTVAWTPTLSNMTRTGAGTFTATAGASTAQVRSVEMFPQARVSLVYRGGDLHIGLKNPALADNVADNFLSLSTPGYWGVGTDWKRHRSYVNFFTTGITPANGQLVEVAHIGTEIRGFIDGVDVGTPILTGVPADRAHQLILIISNAGTYVDNLTFSRSGYPGVDGIDGIDGTDGKLVEFVWRRSPTQPATPTGNGIPAGWSDDPPSGTDPLWMSKAKQELDGTLVAGESWSTPVRHDGPPGQNGTDGYTIAPSSLAFSIACGSDGTVKAGEFDKVVTFVVRQGGGADLASDAATGFSAAFSNCTGALSGNRGQTLTITGMSADSATVDVTVTRASVTIGVVRVTLTKAKDGVSPGPSYSAIQITDGITLHPERFVLNNGQTLSAEARYRTLGDTVTGFNNQLQIQVAPAGSNSWAVMTNGSNTQSNGPGDPVTLGVGAGTFTNNSGITQSYQLRTVIVNNGGGTELPERCFLRPA